MSSTSPNPVPGNQHAQYASTAPPAMPDHEPESAHRRTAGAWTAAGGPAAGAWQFGDVAKDLGAILVYGFGLGTMFFAGQHVLRPLHEENLVMALATVAVVAVVVSSVMRATVVGTPALRLLVRWIPAALLSLVAFAYLIGLYLPFTGNEINPGLGFGLVVVLALAILTGAPRTGEADGGNRFIWGCYALAVLLVLTIANITVAVHGGRVAEASFASVVTVLAMAALLWLPIPAGRSIAVFAAAGLLILRLVVPGDPEASMLGGAFAATFGFGPMLLVTGLLAAGFLPPRDPGRRFADGTAWLVILSVLCAVAATGPLASVQSGIGNLIFLILAGVAGAVHLGMGRSNRRCRALPALAVSAALLLIAVIFRLSSGLGGFGTGFHVPLVLAVLAFVALARADKDPGFEILTPALRSRESTPEALALLEANAYRQSAGVFAALSLLTGPLGLLFGVLALGRANRAESAGLQTTAIRMVAGIGIAVAIAATLYLWLVARVISSSF